MEEIALGAIGLTEIQLWQMTPRTFHNILSGRKYEIQRRDAEWKQQMFMHHELVLAVLSPHMKQGDRDRAYAELSGKTSAKPKKAKQMTPEEVKTFLESQNKTK